MAYLQRRNLNRKQRLCQVCSQICTFGFIFCDQCCKWSHIPCEQIPEEKAPLFEHLSPDFSYICRHCRSDQDGVLDYSLAQLRLQKASSQSFKKLQACVKREDLFLDTPFVGVAGVGSLLVDTEAQTLMQSYLKRDKGIPAETSSEDYVLFRAVSTAVSARDTLAVELRVRCCIEMVKYEQFYRYQPNHQLLARCSPDYSDSCIDCAMTDEGSSVWTLSALASVVRRPIMSVYPSVNGINDPVYKALNTVFEPREKDLISSQLLRILWTSKDSPIVPGKWKPNHFVPLFDQQKQEVESSPAKGQIEEVDMESSQDGEAAEFSGDSFEQHVPEDIEEDLETVPMKAAVGGFPVEFNRFMDIYEAFEKVTNATEVHSDIPKGVKENVWFLLDNTYNLQHPERRNVFCDDCGVWDSQKGSVAKTYLLLDDDNGIKCSLKIRNGSFVQLRVKGRNKPKDLDNEWVEMSPQPPQERIVVCHRYYAFLKRDKEYKRRIIWFTMPPCIEKGHDVAIVEYMGKFPGFKRQRHGNCTRGRGKRSYIRTDPRLLEEIAKELAGGTHLTPMKLFRKIQEKMGPDCTLRDPRQIRNLKYSLRRKFGKLGRLPIKHEQEEYSADADQGGSEISLLDMSNAALEGDIQKVLPFKLIIQQGNKEVETLVNSMEEFTDGDFGSARFIQIQDGNQTKYLQIEECQQAVSFVEDDDDNDNNTTQTIIMVKDFNSALPLVTGENEVLVTHPI